MPGISAKLARSKESHICRSAIYVGLDSGLAQRMMTDIVLCMMMDIVLYRIWIYIYGMYDGHGAIYVMDIVLFIMMDIVLYMMMDKVLCMCDGYSAIYV